MYRRITEFMKGLHYLVLIVGLVSAATFPILAQSVSPQSRQTGISGTVVDPTDNTIPGATVVCKAPNPAIDTPLWQTTMASFNSKA